MQHNVTTVQRLIDTSHAAMILWNQLGFELRAEILRGWAQQLPLKSAAMVQFQCANALKYAAKHVLMPGPTGESNTLYCSGRGVFIVTAQEGITEEAIVG